ncbi:MAG TPA: hypothetical protein DCE41_37410 [Cytophagales bacterium]|nr:hypothetical protein [Cytophagales bacterium]HAA19423.1 hypothetical protein [Cytophagales bacterium]HAP63363.1 hypothetical protein [Cytophagales bacterium]
MRTGFFLLILSFYSSAAWGQDAFEWVFLNHRPEKEELPQGQIDSLMQLHFANMGTLAKAGHLLAAGPFYEQGGIFVFSTPKEMTDSLVRTDPAVQADRWRVEQFNWRPSVGSICPQPEGTEMTTYSFLRFSPTGMAWTEAQFQEQIGYLSDLEVKYVTLGFYDQGSEGMLLIYADDPKEELGVNAPAVKQGWYTPDLQQLYIAKGTFCEVIP